MNETVEKYDLCKNNFEYFLYDLRANRHRIKNFSGKYITSSGLLDDSQFEKYFLFYKQIIKEEQSISLIKNHSRKIGVTTFLAFYTYYCNYYNSCGNIFWVTDAKQFSRIGKIITEISFVLQDIMNCMVSTTAASKQLSFSHNSSTVKFLNDTTYEFRAFKEKIDLIVFDSATIHNYDKLVVLLSVKDISEKIILNFDFKREEIIKKITAIELEFNNINIIENIN